MKDIDIDRLMLVNQIAIMRALTTTDNLGDMGSNIRGELDKAISASVRALMSECAEQKERRRLLAAMYGDGPGAGGI